MNTNKTWFLENENHEWIAKEEFWFHITDPTCRLTIDPQKAKQFDSEFQAQQWKAGHGSEYSDFAGKTHTLIVNGEVDLFLKFGDLYPDDFTATEHEFLDLTQ
jgi:hypothetical protein